MRHIKEYIKEYSPKVKLDDVLPGCLAKVESYVINAIKQGKNSVSITLTVAEEIMFTELQKTLKEYGIKLKNKNNIYIISWKD